jgi:hypothetical protein
LQVSMWPIPGRLRSKDHSWPAVWPGRPEGLLPAMPPELTLHACFLYAETFRTQSVFASGWATRRPAATQRSAPRGAWAGDLQTNCARREASLRALPTSRALCRKTPATFTPWRSGPGGLLSGVGDSEACCQPSVCPSPCVSVRSIPLRPDVPSAMCVCSGASERKSCCHPLSALRAQSADQPCATRARTSTIAETLGQNRSCRWRSLRPALRAGNSKF